MTRRPTDRGQTFEVVVDEPGAGDPAQVRRPPRRRPRHPWRWATATIGVVVLVGAVVGSLALRQHLGTEVDVVDAGIGWTDGDALTCSEGTEAAVHVGSPDSQDLAADPHDVVTLTNRGPRTVTLRVSDPTRGAFEAGSVVADAEIARRAAEGPGATVPSIELPPPTSRRTVDRVSIPAGASVRLRLADPELTIGGGGEGTARRASIGLRVTSLGLTTAHVVPLRRSIVTWVPGTQDPTNPAARKDVAAGICSGSTD